MTTLKIKKVHADAKLPQYQLPGSSGMDLHAVQSVYIAPGEHNLVKTGIKIELPKGFEAQVRPRSGLALKNSITVLNSPGTIDQGFLGEICVILVNHGKSGFRVDPGDRIAQLVIAPVEIVEIQEVDELSETERGEGGFGSTGV